MGRKQMSSSNRREYLTATVLDQGLLDRCADNLDQKIEMVLDIETPGDTIYASNRNKYVGGIFYEALAELPIIKRSIGEWLIPELEFSRLSVPISNVNGRFNEFNPGGANFGGWIGKRIDMKMGLRDVTASYFTVYSGFVSDVGGFQRDRANFTIITRDFLDKFTKDFPSSVFTSTSFPDIESGLIGTLAPVIYGDWTVDVNAVGASIPGYPVNGANAGVLAFTTSVQVYISSNDNVYLDTASFILKRGDIFWPFNSADVSIVTGNRVVDIKQSGNGGVTLVDGSAYQFQTGDVFYCKVKGQDLGAYDDNLVAQAKHILLTYGGAISGDFDANWDTYRDKASPAESAISTIKSRVYLNEAQPVMQYVLSMLEQVRLEPFPSRDLKLKLFALHLDEFPSSPSFTVKNWDIEYSSLTPRLDDRNIWNRAKADYSFDPLLNENRLQTPIFRNSPAIVQQRKEISKKVVFPNLYIEADVIYQLKEMLKLASAGSEFIEVNLTQRALLLDIGNFIKLNLDFGGIIYENVPAIIREIGYDPKGRIPVKLWSLQMTPYPGYTPGYAGTVGGSTATITQE
jgi:hypothetical protein